MKRLIVVIVLVVVAVLYGYFGVTSTYDVDQLLVEEYILTDTYIEVSSPAPLSDVNNRITRVFEIYADGTWSIIDLVEYQTTVNEFSVDENQLGHLTLGSSIALTGTSKVSSKDTTIGQFKYPIQLSSRFETSKDLNNIELSLFDYRKFEQFNKVIDLQSDITFTADREKTIKFFFKPYVIFENVNSEVLFTSPAYTKLNVIGYIEVRSN